MAWDRHPDDLTAPSFARGPPSPDPLGPLPPPGVPPLVLTSQRSIDDLRSCLSEGNRLSTAEMWTEDPF